MPWRGRRGTPRRSARASSTACELVAGTTYWVALSDEDTESAFRYALASSTSKDTLGFENDWAIGTSNRRYNPGSSDPAWINVTLTAVGGSVPLAMHFVVYGSHIR